VRVAALGVPVDGGFLNGDVFVDIFRNGHGLFIL
jgi:hypothetical protein